MSDPAVHVIVFSKDRPLQLHGYLTSLFEQWHGGFETRVLARRREPYVEAYRQAVRELPNTQGVLALWDEDDRHFAQDLGDILRQSTAPLTCFGCDDAVFVAPVEADRLPPLFETEPRLLGISLRLGETVRRGMWGHEMAQPRLRRLVWEYGDPDPPPACLEWDPTATGSAGDWAYPWEVVGTVYRTDFVRRMVAHLAAEGLARNPSTLEHYGAQRWPGHVDGPVLLRCWERPRLVLPTVNVVQSTFPNGTVGDDRLSPDFLLECWSRGLRLDTRRYATGPRPDSWRVGDFYLRRAA